MSDFDVGQLRHRVAIQSPPTGRDRMNQPTGDWVTVTTLWAHVEPLSGRELFNARQLQATTTHRITIRGGPTIPATYRLAFEGTGRIFNIDSVHRVGERNAYLAIMATEKTI